MADDQVVPLSTLRAELAQMELRIVDRLTEALAKKADVIHMEQLEARVNSLELSRAARESMPSDLMEMQKDISDLKRFRYAVPSVAFLSFALAGFTLALNYL